jgi:hypothetical protein
MQLLALVIFVLHSWSHLHATAVVRLPTAPYGDIIDEIIGTLLRLSTAHTLDTVRLDGVPEAAQAAIAAGLAVISADKFMSAVQPVVTCDNEIVRLLLEHF